MRAGEKAGDGDARRLLVGSRNSCHLRMLLARLSLGLSSTLEVGLKSGNSGNEDKRETVGVPERKGLLGFIQTHIASRAPWLVTPAESRIVIELHV